jgi:hypothetical protein
MIKYLHLKLIALSAVCPARLMDGMLASCIGIGIPCQAKVPNGIPSLLIDWSCPKPNDLIVENLVSDRKRFIPWDNRALS